MRKYTIKQNITDGKQEEVLQAEEILEDKIIDKKIIAKIRQRYSIDQECEMRRKRKQHKNEYSGKISIDKGMKLKRNLLVG